MAKQVLNKKWRQQEREREGRWRERRVGEMHPHYTVTLWVLFSIGKTASGYGMAAWVPEMPGCVDLKESLKEHQRHNAEASEAWALRNYSEWNWQFEATTKLRNDRLTAATTLNLSDLYLHRCVLWACASKSPLCATLWRPYFSSSEHPPNWLKQIVGSEAAASLAFSLWSRLRVQRQQPIHICCY